MNINWLCDLHSILFNIDVISNEQNRIISDREKSREG